MVKWVQAIVGLVLFAAGVAVGIAVMRIGVAERQADPITPISEEMQAASQEKKTTPTPAGGNPLRGLWRLTPEADYPVFLYIYPDGYLSAWASSNYFSEFGVDSAGYRLEMKDGKKLFILLAGKWGHHAFRYQLDGQTLKLTAESKDTDGGLNLSGVWKRVE